MNTEDYVSYPIALALKKAGFDWKCRAHYTNDYVNDDSEDVSREVKFHYDWTSPYDYNRIVGNTSAPFIWQAQKWLRDKKRFQCQVLLNGVRSMFFWQVREMRGNGRYADSTHQYDVYEDAMSDCIAAALELIKEKGE